METPQEVVGWRASSLRSPSATSDSHTAFCSMALSITEPACVLVRENSCKTPPVPELVATSSCFERRGGLREGTSTFSPRTPMAASNCFTSAAEMQWQHSGTGLHRLTRLLNFLRRTLTLTPLLRTLRRRRPGPLNGPRTRPPDYLDPTTWHIQLVPTLAWHQTTADQEAKCEENQAKRTLTSR